MDADLSGCDLQAGKIVKAGNRVGESAGAGALFHFRGLEGKVGKNYLGKKTLGDSKVFSSRKINVFSSSLFWTLSVLPR